MLIQPLTQMQTVNLSMQSEEPSEDSLVVVVVIKISIVIVQTLKKSMLRRWP